jgi:hypothetical protein
MKTISVQQFLAELRPVLHEVRDELRQREAGMPGVGTIGELHAIQNELSEIEAQALAGTLPPGGQRWLAASRIVTDTWPHESTLGDNICALATKYRKQLE